MATTGRPATPTKLALLKGKQKDRINHNEPQPEVEVEIPEGVELGRYGRWEWDRLIGDLKSKDVVTGWDIQALAMWCEQVDIHWRSAEIIREEGLMIEEIVFSKGEPIGERYKVNPAWKANQDSLNNMIRLSARFGFTPSDRAGISVSPPKAKGTGEDLLTG
jgi:P27 family predicted phage terminase small subunit